MKHGIALFAAILALGACATTETPSISKALRETTGQTGRACVRTDDIQSYGVRSDNTLNVDGLRHYYVLTLRPGCHNLATSAATMFSGDFSELCGGRMDKLVSGGDWCTVEHIFQFEDRAEAFRAYDEAQRWREQPVR